MKVAFTSCSDPLDWQAQQVWSLIAAQQPGHLILLGDQIYMDYGAGHNPGLGEPAGMSAIDFAAHMYLRYASQWRIMQNSGLWQVPDMKVHGIWDDHDFAWNNAYGAGVAEPAGNPMYQPVPADKQQISRYLFRQFFGHLRASAYPANALTTPDAVAGLSDDLSKPLYFSESLSAGAPTGRVALAPGVNLLLTDGRSFRTSPRLAAAQRTLLGRQQMDWLKNNIENHAVSIVASGCTLDDSKEAWNVYRDYDELKSFLASRGDARVLLLSGDIHNTSFRAYHGPNLIEVVASGAARPFGNVFAQDKGNFAVLEIDANSIRVNRHEGEPPQGGWKRSRVIDRASWRVAA
jgi:alkaline phosphatase D